MNDKTPGASIGNDALAALGQRAVDGAVGADDAGEIHFGDHFDDSRTADPGNAEPLHRFVEPRVVGPQLRTNDTEAGLERFAIDAHAFDRPGGGPLAAGDLRTFKGRAGRARAGEQAIAVTEHDLGVRAYIDDQRGFLQQVRLFSEHHRGGVGTDVAGDAGQNIDRGAGIDGQAEFPGAEIECVVRGQRERRGAKFDRTYAEEQVVHDRVAGDRHVEDIVGLDVGLARDTGDEFVDSIPDNVGQLACGLGLHLHVRHAAHQVLAEAYLRVHHAAGVNDLAGREVAEVRGDRRRADIDGETVDAALEAGPDRDDARPLVNCNRDAPAALSQR